MCPALSSNCGESVAWLLAPAESETNERRQAASHPLRQCPASFEPTYILRGKTISGKEGEKVESGSAALIAYLCSAAGFAFRLSASRESASAIPTKANTFSEGPDSL